MAIDQWGRYTPDYNYNYNPQNYREELLRQKEAIEYRLSDFDKRYQPQPQQIPQEPSVPPVAPSNKPIQPYIVVSSEKEARDYPIVNKLDDEIGRVHIFAMNDESSLFAKRINPSTFDMEFEAYDRRIKAENIDDAAINKDEGPLASIDARLKKIEQFVDSALSMFMSGGIPQKTQEQEKPKTPNKPNTSKKDESEAE